MDTHQLNPFLLDKNNTTEPYVLDDLDLAICEILSDNCRISFRTIARKVHKAPLTVKIRIDNLIKQKIIKSWGAHLDYEKLGYEFISIVEIDVARGKTSSILQYIAENPHVFGVYDITGDYEAILLIRTQNRLEYTTIINNLLQSPDITKVTTRIVLKAYKDASTFADITRKRYENLFSKSQNQVDEANQIFANELKKKL